MNYTHHPPDAWCVGMQGHSWTLLQHQCQVHEHILERMMPVWEASAGSSGSRRGVGLCRVVRAQVPCGIPGPAYDLTFCEVRDTSLVMLWKAPVYTGSSPVSGYLVDFKEEDSGEWKTVNEAATPNRYLKVMCSFFPFL